MGRNSQLKHCTTPSTAVQHTVNSTGGWCELLSRALPLGDSRYGRIRMLNVPLSSGRGVLALLTALVLSHLPAACSKLIVQRHVYTV